MRTDRTPPAGPSVQGFGTMDSPTMHRHAYSVADLLERGSMEQPPELRRLFHQLNNQLGIILAHAELMEQKASDQTSRARAGQVVSSVLDAMGTAKAIRLQIGSSDLDRP
jgi:hypothetical protein